MNVPSFAFIAFAAVAALAINLSAKPYWRRAVLLLVNLAFVGSFTTDPLQLAPFAGFLLFGFACIKLLEVRKVRPAFAVAIVAVVAIYCWLKHYAFIPHGLFLPFTYFTVGMSYVLFRVLHLAIDAYQGSLSERIGPLSYANYTLNFTALVSGPIQLYGDYRRTECVTPAALNFDTAGAALERLIEGFFKVAVISPILASGNAWSIAGLTSASTAGERIGYATLALTLFPIYLYANFAGYTDLVIGIARFLRLELPENFAKPFMATGFMDFWGRWHMSLSAWFKTYVYSTLLINLMRRFPSREAEPYLGVITFFITFFLVGVWHGQTTEFLLYGVLQGTGVSVNKLYQIVMLKRLGRKPYRALCDRPLYAAFSRGLTFVYFSFTLLWFWSSWSQLGGFAALLGPGATLAVFVIAVAGATLLLAILKLAGDAFNGHIAAIPSAPYVRTAWSTVLAMLTISTAILNAPAPHVVYRGF